ncbi:hypothetical protein [Sphingomonas sp. S2-65]|uniref:hypothetical protein n=1 Tax=Sphingomonas sp. S2-65 TaxID=2903960 RepID=UPI001F1D8B5E|nr:hypothetical protein [Sphingomonas sp. S2-65]UYY58008.1 hypothetical protein LZ586_15290 [Sphingomonas sp. S2-65]
MDGTQVTGAFSTGRRKIVQSLGQRYHRDKLAKLLSMTSFRDIVGMSWSAWAMQNGHADAAGKYMNFPPEAADGEAGAKLVIYPWQLETLVNEALALQRRADPRGRTLVTDDFSSILRLVKLVQRIEEADDGAFLQSNDVLYEMHRLTQRQFEWQRGFANMPRFYRTLRTFGGSRTAEHFKRQVGCTIPEFIEAGFFLFAGSTNSATRIWSSHHLLEGVTAEQRDLVLRRISTTPELASVEAAKLRLNGDHAGYKPSVLRKHPILRFGLEGREAMAPVPPLILQRITSGLYFDIVDGGGAIWAEVGKQFEGYCLDYIGAMLDAYRVAPETRYGPKGRGFDTPDILVSDDRAVRLAIECKAKRMPIDARFSGNPVREASGSYAEIAKGVFQVWRFFSHARRGIYGPPVAEDCLGMVVTSDPWLVMGQKLHPEVMAMANAMADAGDPAIAEVDRRRVPIVLVDDLEYLLQHAPPEEMFVRLRALSADASGWEWSLVHGLPAGSERSYPFARELGHMLPRAFARE